MKEIEIEKNKKKDHEMINTKQTKSINFKNALNNNNKREEV